jgi:predicted transposase/invertase (TIGR01784 family)
MTRGAGGGRRTLDPKLDVVFSMLFGAEQNRELLISLLNAVLRPSKPIVSVEVLPAEPERTSVDDKSIALDVRVRFEGGEQADVEMQSQRHLALRERMLYYWARLYSGQLQRGAPYLKLRRCAVILITDFVELTTPRFHSIFQVREREDGRPLTDHLELHVIELPKLQSALERNDEPSLAAWGKFLAATNDEDLEALAMENPVLKQAKEALDNLSADPDARIRAERREIALLMYELERATVHREALAEGLAAGKTEGLAAGKTEGKAELLLQQLAFKFGEPSASVAERVAGATDAELLRWSRSVLSADSVEAVFQD